MSRRWIAAALLVTALLAALAALAWWTASPAADERELAAALAAAPSADGRVALAQPRRSARWLVRHPQALALVAFADPAARPSLSRLQPLARPLVDAAQGPLVVWWRGRDLAAGARLRPGALQAIAVLAARHGLVSDVQGDVARVATSPELLGAPAPAPEASGAADGLAALAEVAGAVWRVTAARDRLVAISGAAEEIADEPGPSWVETRNAAFLAQALGAGSGAEPIAARAVFGAADGWAIAVDGAALPDFLRRAMPAAGSAGSTSPALHWDGILGDVWVRATAGRVLVATGEPLLDRVAQPPAGERGRVKGKDLTWLTGELAANLSRLPLLDREARDLRAVGAQAAGLGVARWAATERGARIELEW